jgi:eukaryotic-like serine/threonine-protein kinase
MSERTMKEEPLLRRIGTVIREKWTIERLLGHGGMAAVYVGVHRIGRRDALKILHPEAANSPEIRARFEREARAVNRLRHPGAVEIRDIDVTEDGAPFLVMELLEGESLSDYARRVGPLPLPTLLSFMDQVLDTIAAAHDKDIIHRDIKPGNIFVLDGGTVKVLDFGLARVRQDGDLQSVWTRTGMALGTTPYMPPEQARGRPIDARADIFAVGATMFKLITGRHVHEASADYELLLKMGREPAPPLASLAEGAPLALCMVVDRALAFDREQRYANARQMLEDIRSLHAGRGPQHACRLEGIDGEAITMPQRAALRAPAEGAAPPRDAGINIPVEWVETSTTMELSGSDLMADHTEPSTPLELTKPPSGAPPRRR